MTRQQRISLDNLAPERIEVPSGSKIRVDYEPNAKPKLSVRLQELFGMTESPRIANGRASVVMDILSPSMRTVQITEDLAGFWRNSYFLVRKDMRGRYPKHDWPENPLDASPHRGVKKRRPENT
jgi:ATP-dependent helicase HrpB